LEDTQAAKFTDKLYVALADFQLSLQKDKAKKRKVTKNFNVIAIVHSVCEKETL